MQLQMQSTRADGSNGANGGLRCVSWEGINMVCAESVRSLRGSSGERLPASFGELLRPLALLHVTIFTTRDHTWPTGTRDVTTHDSPVANPSRAF